MRRRKTPSTYRFHKASGRAFVQIGGRRLYLGEWGSAESHAAYVLALAAAYLPHIDADELVSSVRFPATVLDVILEFRKSLERLDDATSYLPTHASLSTMAPVMRLWRESFGDVPVRKLSLAHRDQLFAALHDANHSKQEVEFASRCILAVLRWGVAHEFVPPLTYAALALHPPFTLESRSKAGRKRPQRTYFLLKRQARELKIGRSCNIPAAIQGNNRGSGERFCLLATLADDRELEIKRKFRDLRLRGEVFRADPRLLTWISENTQLELGAEQIVSDLL